MPRCRFSLAICVVMLTGAAAAQQKPPAFRSSARLIVEVVTVSDSHGTPIPGLTAGDFEVTEDGVPQTVAFAEFQHLDPSRATSALAPAPDDTTTAVQAPTPRAPAAGIDQYRERRLLVLYFDMSAMPVPDQMRAYTQARRFVDTRLTPLELVAVMTFQAGAVHLTQDFTGDRSRLLAALDSIGYENDQNGDGTADNRLPVAAFGQADAEFAIFNTDRQLSALQTAVTMFRSVPEQKALIYFASGLRLNGTDNHAQLRATINAAVRANVAIHAIDARGLQAAAPLGDATATSPGGIGMFSGQSADSTAATFQRSQDTLYALAKDTGGQVLLDRNDLSLGIAAALNSIVSYYLVGYYSTNPAADGRFRRVQVVLTKGRAATLSYRRGYFGDKAFAAFTRSDKERQLEDALMLEDPITDIPVAIEVNYFQVNKAEYFTPVAVKLPGSELTLARRRGAAQTEIDIIGEVKDDHGGTIQNVRDRLVIKLSDEVAGQLPTRPVHYETGFTLLPGRYIIKLLVRDATTGRMGTYQTAFSIPNLEREEERVPISSVVLSNQRVALSSAIHTVRQRIDEDAGNPLVHDGQKLIPSVTRVFSRQRNLYVFLETYAREATTAQPLIAYVAFYRGGVKSFETAPVTIAPAEVGSGRPAALSLSIPLEAIDAGPYECQVTVLSLGQAKAAFWRAPIVVVP